MMRFTPRGPAVSPTFDKTKRYRDTVAPYPKAGIEAASAPFVTVGYAWATWCGPCKKDLPLLQAFMDKGHGRIWSERVQFAAVHSMSNGYQGLPPQMHATQIAQDWAGKFPDGTLHCYDTDEDAALLSALTRDRVTADVQIPLTFVVDCHGRVRWKHEGELIAGVLQDKLEPAIQQLLTELAQPGGCPVAGDGQCSPPTERCEKRFGRDCRRACHNNGKCELWAGESYKNPVFFAQDGCRHPMPECRAEYHPVKHRYCIVDKICSRADGEPSDSIDCLLEAGAARKKRAMKARAAAAAAKRKASKARKKMGTWGR